MRAWIAWLAGAGALAGCDAAMAPIQEVDPAIRTDAAVYVLEGTETGWEAEIPYTFTNRTGEAVSLVNCNGGFALRLDRWDGAEWKAAWSPVLPACLSQPIVIEPGAVYRDTLGFFAGYPETGTHPRLEGGDVEGTYRLVWTGAVHDYDPDRAGGIPIPLDHRRSNAFELRR